MGAITGPSSLAAAASTGNNTHVGIAFSEEADAVCLLFVVEAVGGTPTVTYKFQGANLATLPGATTDWFDLMVDPAETDTGVATATKTAVGSYAYFLRGHRFAKWVRCVTSANTNVTYRAELWNRDSETREFELA